MKIFLIALTILILATPTSHSQEIHTDNFKMNLNDSHTPAFEPAKSNSSEDFTTAALIFAWMVNPIIVYEDKHVDIGLTKEVTLFVFPFTRLAAEYSRIFRSSNKDQFRISANLEIPFVVSDYGALSLGVGGGYFTDFKHTGYFPQAGVSFLFGPGENIGTNIYTKARYTFVTQEEKSNIFDFSVGAGLMFWF